MKRMILTAYGNENNVDKGIVIIEQINNHYLKKVLPIDGKSNCCIIFQDKFYVPVKKEKNFIYEYQMINNHYQKTNEYETRYFYSYGFVKDDLLFLASFESGVDTIFDLKTKKEIDYSIHNNKLGGRSHYIALTLDHKYIYAIDNAYQQIYLYKIENKHFIIYKVVRFENENIRLMPFSPYSQHGYLNTEISNRIYILSYKDGDLEIISKQDMKTNSQSFSGGNAISEDGKHLCISIRGDNVLNFYDINKDGTLELIDSISCGKMPRDIQFFDDTIAVTCTNDHCIELYQLIDSHLRKVDEIKVFNPITFSL